MGAFGVVVRAPGGLNRAVFSLVQGGRRIVRYETDIKEENFEAIFARAIADLALARSKASPQRFYSMPAQIRIARSDHYDELKRIQKGAADVTEWLTWFLACLGRAIHGADCVLAAVIAKAQFWERAAALALNERQIKILKRRLDGFEGKMTSSKWAIIARCSQDTANRDLGALRHC
jgi:Fic family protein